MEFSGRHEGLRFRHYLLFLLTLFATTLTGIALHPDGSDFSEGLLLIKRSPSFLLQGLPYSLSLLFIIICHEYGHIRAARKHEISVTMPYFIPAPPYITLGTLGAFIRIKSHISSRSALIDMGALGPIYGFLASMIVLIIGYASFFMGYHLPTDFGFNIRYPLIFALFRGALSGNFSFEGMLFENPLIASAWIGFFIQGLNLLPVGQLDGGHILYAFFPKNHKLIGRFLAVLFIALTPFGLHFLVWAVLFFVLGFDHPPTLDNELPLRQETGLPALFAWRSSS
jgi:membrane-associated protease RseP (regulator of RpoE activity)